MLALCICPVFAVVRLAYVEIKLKGRTEFGASLSLSTPPTDVGDRWTCFIITPDGLAAIQPDSLTFDTLNLAEKSERQIALLAAYSGLHLEETHQCDYFSCGHWSSLNGEVLSC